MKYAVSYYTRSGNTKKLADVAAGILGVEAHDIADGLTEKVDVLFLGNSLYAFTIEPSVGEFIEKNADKIGTLVNFSTSASGNSTSKKIKELAESRGIKFYNHGFKCPGSFMFMNKNRPNEKDVSAFESFVKGVIDDIK